MATPPVSVTTMATSTTPILQSTGAIVNDTSFFIGVGVAGILLIIITAAAIIVTVLVCLRKKTNKLNITDNVAYQSSTSEVKLCPNAAYTATGDNSSTSHDQEYMYMTTVSTDSQQVTATTSTDKKCNTPTSTNVHMVYKIPACTNPACVPTSTSETTTSTNEAYDVPSSADGVYNIPTSTSAAYEITTSSECAYIATDIPTSTNQTYGAAQHQSGSDTLSSKKIIYADGIYYMSASTDDIPATTDAYEITTSSNTAYGATDVPTSTNQAYEAAQYESRSDTPAYDREPDILTSTSAAYEITTSSEYSYIATDVPTSTNQAYEAAQHQSRSNTLADEVYSMPASTDGERDSPTPNSAAYEITTFSDYAYVATDVSTSTNQAYEVAQHQIGSDTLTDEVYSTPASTDGERDSPTPNSAAYEITTSGDYAYVATDVPTSTNQAYGAAQHQSGRDTLPDEAYSMPAPTEGEHDILTNDEAYEITPSTNSGYVVTDVSTSTNRAQEAALHQSGIDTLSYEAYYMSSTTNGVTDIRTSFSEITTSSNSAYIATDVPTSTNLAYGIDTLSYEYVIHSTPQNSCHDSI